MQFCSKCGYKMNDGDKFCFNCGQPNKKLADSNTHGNPNNDASVKNSGGTEILKQSQKKQTYAAFQYKEGGQDKKFMMEDRILNIGRNAEECELTFTSDRFIGRKHALIYYKNMKFYIVDLNSRNGTFVNGERIQGIKQLDKECVLKFANTEVKFNASI